MKRLATLIKTLVVGAYVSLICVDVSIAASEAGFVSRVTIITGQESTAPELKAAEILANRILKRSSVSIKMAKENDSEADEFMEKSDLIVVIGSPSGNQLTKQLMQELGMKLPMLPRSKKIHPEGFAVKSGEVAGRDCIVIAGTDERGTLYGAGWLLRALTYRAESLVVPTVDVQEKPAFPMRGGVPTGPSSRAHRYGQLRPETASESLEIKEDLMLLGTNIFEGRESTYGMLSRFGRTANGLPPKPDGSPGFPKAWGANGGRSDRFICPSVPEARKALLDSYDKMFRDAPEYDFFSANSGDPGGCRCDKCMPWGGTYIELMHEIADRLHKYHPSTKILATNQNLTNDGNLAVFEYLNSQDSSWLHAIYYGPGADEMQTYIRGAVNPRWFEYEGFGALGNYLKYMHHELPRTTAIVLFSDITHWMQAQYAVPRPDLALAAVYDRRSWNARPRHFHKVGQEVLHYTIGDVHYSEGMHDDFNKWLWYRLLWNPRQDVESITKEYCRYWFGTDAQNDAAEAIFLMEETLEKPVVGNPGIVKAVELLDSAGHKIPKNLLQVDYRWRVISQKALMDRYIQLMLERGEKLKHAATPFLKQVESASKPATVLKEALQLLDRSLVTAEMQAVMVKARQLGEESNEIAGYRVPAMFIVDTLDLTEVGWWKKTLAEALTSGSDVKMKNAAKMVLRYDDPGEGGFYDDLGWPNVTDRLTRGESLWGFRPFPGPAKRSQYNLAYSMSETRGVSLAYEELDPKTEYVVRISIGVHDGNGGGSNNRRGIELKQGLQADGQIVSGGFAIPRDSVTYQEFDIPSELTRDGKLEITLTNSSEVLPITAAYEVWLMDKDMMPWTARP
jgi:hypothetical protein